MTDGIKHKHRAAIVAAIAANERVNRAVLFGSRATGTHAVTSDVDIALFGDRLSLTDQARLGAAIDEIPMAQSVDLLLHRLIDNPALLEHIQAQGVEWYRRPNKTEAEPPLEKQGGTDARLHLAPRHRQVLEALLRRHLPNVEVWAYGSRVNGRSHDGSDLDLVLRAPGLGEIPGSQLQDFKEAVRESNIPFPVEASDWAQLAERFHREIKRDYVVLVNGRCNETLDWYETTLGEIVDIKHGFPFKGEFIHEDPRGDRLLTPGNFAIGGGFKNDKFKYYDGPVSDEFVLCEGDLLVTMTDLSKQSDTLGYPAFVPRHIDGHRYLHNQRLGKISVTGSSDVELNYIYYVMCGSKYRDEVLASATGTTVKHTSPERLKQFRFLIPPVCEQRAIAHILGTLDDKIELSRRMIETLEAMARALFKSWFVDFDPVRAKMEGRDPGLPPSLNDLFPDHFVDSELGQVPEGWEVQTLADHFDAAKGLSYKGSGLGSSGVPLHNLNSIYEGGGYKYAGIKYYDGEYAERHLVGVGDVIVANTEQGHERLLIGHAAVVPALYGDFGIVSHHIYRLRRKAQSPITSTFLCHLLNSAKMHQIVSGYANGTTVNMLPIDGVQKPMIVCPPQPLVLAFDSLASTVGNRSNGLVSESHTLAVLRKTILPELISGDLRVKNRGQIVESTY